MNRIGMLCAACAAAGLAGNSIAQPAPQADILWMSVCDRPDMRIAIELGDGDEQPDPSDCAKACHAATCRKALNADDHDKGDGAVV